MNGVLVSKSKAIRATLSLASPALALLVALAWGATAAAPPKDLAPAKPKILDNPLAFPVSTASATVNVGTFNATTNKFDGLVTETVEGIKGRPPTKIVPVERVNTESVRLVFHAVNHKATVTFTVNGTPHPIAAGKTSVTADVGKATDVKWSVKAGDKIRHRDELKLEHAPPPEPGSFRGEVNGKAAAVQARKGVPSPKGATSYKQVGEVFDLKKQLAGLWNDNPERIKGKIRDILKEPIGGYQLYDAKITLAEAGASGKMWMSLSPKNKRVFVQYSIPGHQINCRADVFGPDATVKINFDAELLMEVRTDGKPEDPLVLKSAYLVARNAKVLANGERKASAEYFVNSMVVNIKDDKDLVRILNIAMAGINEVGPIRDSVNQGFTIVTPRHTLPGITGADLLLEMSAPPPVVGPSKK